MRHTIRWLFCRICSGGRCNTCFEAFTAAIFNLWCGGKAQNVPDQARLFVIFLDSKSQYWVAAYAVTKRKLCHFDSLSNRPAADGDLLACNDIGREGDRMLSLTLILSNFH
jgi:hypothetical protein